MNLQLTIGNKTIDIVCKKEDAFIIEQAVSIKPPPLIKPHSSIADLKEAMAKAKAYALENKCVVNVKDFMFEV